MLKATSVGVDQSPQVETPNMRRLDAAEYATPAYWMSAYGAMAGFDGLTTCSSKGLTSDSSVVGKVPVHAGPAPRVPVQTPEPESGMAVEPVGLPPVGMVAGAAMVEAARLAR